MCIARALVAVVVCLPFASARAAPPAEALHVAECAQTAGEYLGTLRHRVILDRAFLDDKLSDAENAKAAILHELKYLWGYLRTDQKGLVNLGDAAHLELVLSAAPPAITILDTSAGVYGRELVLDWKQSDPRLVVDDDYTLRAVRRGYTKATDAALIVDFEARFSLVLCDGPRAAESTLEVPLPADPWLLYWHVPAAHRRLMRYFDETAVTNPCSDDDFADLPHPFYYWYDWQPGRHGPDAAGKEFDCTKWLHAGVDYFPRTVHLTRTAEPQADFANLRQQLAPKGDQPLRATVLIGVLDHGWKDLAFARAASEIGARGDGATLVQRTTAMLGGSRPLERGTGFFLAFLRDLREIASVNSFSTMLEGGYLGVTVEGKLKKSGRPIAVSAWVGPTDVFGPTPPGHWQILRRALARDEIILYAGHSGIGENFRLANIEKKLSVAHADLSAEIARAPFHVIAFLSCYSYMYFGEDLIAAGAAAGALVYTATPFTKGDRGALAVLDMVDSALAGVEAVKLRFVDREDFLVVKGFKR